MILELPPLPLIPDYDTQEVLKDYAENNGVTNPNWNFMTGDKEAIYNLANSGFNLYAARLKVLLGGLSTPEILHLLIKKGIFAPERMLLEILKYIIKELLVRAEQFDEDGDSEDITALKEDILKLLGDEK